MVCQPILMLIVALDKFVCICISICEGVRFIMKRNCDTVLEGGIKFNNLVLST